METLKEESERSMLELREENDNKVKGVEDKLTYTSKICQHMKEKRERSKTRLTGRKDQYFINPKRTGLFSVQKPRGGRFWVFLFASH